jgi:putative ABC transport system permease protein
MDTLLRDIKYSFRRLQKSPGFTAITVMTLALGIGANTAIFSVVNTILLRPLPYREPEQLVTIEHFYPSLNDMRAPVSARGFRDYRDKTQSFDAVGVETGWGVNLTGTGDPERIPGAKVSGDWFRTLGIAPARGRALQRDDDEPGHEHVVVISDGLWRRLYGSDPAAVGKTMLLNDETYQIVGVMPPDFRPLFSGRADVFAPLALTAQQFSGGYTNEYLNLTARLKRGVTIERAAAEMKRFADNLKREIPDQFAPTWSLTVRSLDEFSTGRIRPVLLVLLGAVGFVLLIACANVANLLLARAAVRIKEIAIRSALGADRMALVRQLLTESVMLALTGGVLGLALAQWSVKSLVGLNPNLPRASEVGIDATVMVFTLAISVFTGLLFGLAPALQTSRTNLQETLKEGGRSGSADFAGRNVRRGLVVAEIALALTLLVGAGLLIKSVARLQSVDPGFDPRNLVAFNLSLPAAKYRTDTVQIQFADQMLARLNALPGVKSAATTSVLPFNGGWSTSSFRIENVVVPPGQNGPWGDIRIVSTKFFETMRLPLIRGRLFNEQDATGSPPVVVIDEVFAKKWFPNQDPIGKRIKRGPDTAPWITVVGVVGHAAHEGLDAEKRIQYYFPFKQMGGRFITVAIRTTGDPMSVVSTARQAVHSVDRDQPLSGIATMETLIEQSMGQRKLAMILLGVFSGIALLLASIGIYGVMSYAVTQRTRELGIRMALGAARSRVLALVVSQGMSLALTGVVLGLAGAYGLTRFLASQLYSVKPTDPATFALVTAALAGTALVATLVPALRATRVDPVVALRDE